MRRDILQEENTIRRLMAANEPKSTIYRKLGCKAETLEKYLNKLKITYSGNRGRKGKFSCRKPAVHYLKLNGPPISSHRLKLKLLEDELRKYALPTL